MTTPPLYAVVLAGGIGSRFWPLSTPERPKQLLPLISGESMLADAVHRLEPLVGRRQILILTSRDLAPAIRKELSMLEGDQILEEPRPAGTAAALAWAAAAVIRRGGSEARMVSVHADWAIGDEDRFRDALREAAESAANHGALATVGIVPTHANPGLGYIQPGEALGGNARTVVRFIEKPDVEAARSMVRDGYLWNSGIFAWRATDYLMEIKAHTPEVASALNETSGDADAFFAAVKESISVDVGVMERSSKVIVLPGDFGWDDVGTWGALRRVRELDDGGNAAHGRVHLKSSTGNVVHTEHGDVVLYGVSDLVVVVKDGITLITTISRADQLKELLSELPSDLVDGA